MTTQTKPSFFNYIAAIPFAAFFGTLSYLSLFFVLTVSLFLSFLVSFPLWVYLSVAGVAFFIGAYLEIRLFK